MNDSTLDMNPTTTLTHADETAEREMSDKKDSACVDCANPLDVAFFGAGAGRGDKLRCDRCHFKNEAAAQALGNDYDSRMTAARDALTRAGVPDVEDAPDHPLLGDVRRKIDLAERIDMLVQTFKDARSVLMGALELAVERAVKAEKERDELESTASFVLRPEVAAFAMLMEEKLLLNDHRPGWKDADVLALLARLHEETRELVRAIGERRDPAAVCVEIGREAADVANFAMMIADVCGALDDRLLLAARQRIAAAVARPLTPERAAHLGRTE